MKTIHCILLALVLNGTTVSLVSAQGADIVLCRMHASSLQDPDNFDAVIQRERSNFGPVMTNYMQQRSNFLVRRADEHDSGCNMYQNNPQLYTQCKGNNFARELAVWLGSVNQAVNGIRWHQTEFGRMQEEAWRLCKLTSLFDCEQVKQLAADKSRQECPKWLGH